MKGSDQASKLIQPIKQTRSVQVWMQSNSCETLHDCSSKHVPPQQEMQISLSSQSVCCWPSIRLHVMPRLRPLSLPVGLWEQPNVSCYWILHIPAEQACLPSLWSCGGVLSMGQAQLGAHVKGQPRKAPTEPHKGAPHSCTPITQPLERMPVCISCRQLQKGTAVR